MKIRAISLHQPWATAVALGSKRIETRGWDTDYRGVLAIHAARRRPIGELLHYGACSEWIGALHRVAPKSREVALPEALPFGAIVAVCRLVGCEPTEKFTLGEVDGRRVSPDDSHGSYAWTERMMGNFAPGRYGWRLADDVALPTPVPCIGRQSFFSWEVPPALHDVPALRELLGPF